MALPWTNLPTATGALLRPCLPRLVDDMLTAIPAEVPGYARRLEGNFGQGIRLGVEVALARFLELPGTTHVALTGTDREVYVGLGRGELRQGRSLTTLLAAYRVGARVAYRTFTTAAREAGLSGDELLSLGEAIFAYIDELSAASVEGYASEQSERAGERDRLRRELVGMLLSGRGDRFAIGEAAAASGWTLPSRLQVVVVPAVGADGLSTRLGPAALLGEHTGVPVAVVPATAPEARQRRDLERALAGRFAVVGPERSWAGAPESMRMAFALVAAVGSTPPERPLWVCDNLVPLLLRREPALVAELSAELLAPLDGLRTSTRRRLEETLLSWLAHRGERAKVAAELHVHPQTVGYRLTQLRGLFGEMLDDPDRRFALELLLRAGASSWA